MRVRTVFLAACLGLLCSEPAFAKCTIENFGVLQITMQGPRPLTQAEINGHPVRFMVDSGAFFSTMSGAVAREFGLSVNPLPPNYRLIGIGGDSSGGLTQVDEFKIAGVALKRTTFLVGGSDLGVAGVIGQNILGLRDAEYDLQHGAVRLMDAKDCVGQNLAYWAGDRPITKLAIEPMSEQQRHTIATILVNGVKMRAAFDTGAGGTAMTPKAAKRAGVKPDSPGAVQAGYSRGFGSHQVPIWRAPFSDIDLGGEKLKNVTLTVTELGGDIDMLVGADFFLAHRVYVSNSQHAMFFTYEGGPVFGVSPTRAVDGAGQTVAVTDSGKEPTDAAGFAARGTASAAKRDFASALGDLDKAVAMAPEEARYYYQRSQVRLGLQQPAQAADDLNKARSLAPKDPEILMTHAAMSLSRRDRPAALDDVKAADAALAPESQQRLALAQLYASLENHEAALATYDMWMRYHSQDAQRSVAFNGRCWARAVLNRELDKALSDCNNAVKMQPATAAFLDSRALVHLRRGENEEAVADYSQALNIQPNMALTRYLRGIAEGRLGQADAAKKDQDAALSISPAVKTQAARFGF